MNEQEKRAKVVKQISEVWEEVKKQLLDKCQHECIRACGRDVECWELDCICEDEHGHNL